MTRPGRGGFRLRRRSNEVDTERQNAGRAKGERTRVLLVHTHPIQYLAPLFRAYAARDEVDITVAYCAVPEPGGFFDPAFGQVIDWGVDLLTGYRHIELKAPFPRWRQFNPELYTLICSNRYDVVLSYGYNFPSAWISLLAAKRAGSLWGFVGDNHTLESPSRVRRVFKPALLRVITRLSSVVVAASVRSAEFYRSRTNRTVVLIPHAVEDDRYRRDAAQINEIDLNRGPETVFVYVGKLVPNKRVADFIAAVARVPGASAWIAGAGPEESTLRKMAQPLGKRVRFFGFVSQAQLPSLYAASDVVVLPSDRETFGLVVSEAAAVGLPAVVTRRCGVVDSLVFHERTGLVVEPGDIDDLSRALHRMTDASFRQSCGRAMSIVAENWSLESNVDAFVRCVTGLGRKSAQPRRR